MRDGRFPRTETGAGGVGGLARGSHFASLWGWEWNTTRRRAGQRPPLLLLTDAVTHSPGVGSWEGLAERPPGPTSPFIFL